MTTTEASGTSSPLWTVATWTGTRILLLLWVLKVIPFPGLDVTGDVSVTYRNWYEVLRTGAFPAGDVTWQYPPAAALPLLAPALLPFLSYATAFAVLLMLADAAVLGLLLHVGRRPGRSRRGAWLWVAGVPLLGPTAYARYDLMVTALAVATLLAGARRPRLLGALAGFGALLKVWPLLLVVGARRGGDTVRSWGAAAATAGGLLVVAAVTLPGSLDFLHAQRGRGTEVESLGALVFHVARHAGWAGEVRFSYGSMEFLGRYVHLVSTLAQVLSVLALGWIMLWRHRARRRPPGTLADAALVAVLLFVVTSRVISPQYMVWLLGLAAVCLLHRGSRMTVPAVLVLAATPVTTLEFPIWFGPVVTSDALGITLMYLRNGLLVAAAVTGGTRLWRGTMPAWNRTAGTGRDGGVSPASAADKPASAP